MKELVIIGASGHGKVAADIAARVGYKNIVFLDDNLAVKNCLHYSVVGTVKDTEKYKESDFFIAIGDGKIRKKIQEELITIGCNIVSLFHPEAIISSFVKIGVGTIVVAGAVINSGTIIGSGCIVNTSSSIDHDCKIGDFSHVAIGAHLAGGVEVGSGSWIGAGAIVNNQVFICDSCIVGSGAVVIHNIEIPGTYVGVPAKRKQKKQETRKSKE